MNSHNFLTLRPFALLALCAAIWTPTTAFADFARGYKAWDQGDYVAARTFLKASAAAGNLDAQNHFGQMEEDGQGGPVNLANAVALYRRAAEAGHPGAQLNLGRMYRSGKGVPQDDTQAVAWYRRAAEQGLSIAQFFMGLMYDTGKGVPTDYTQAYKWFDLAARQGDEDARYKRDRLARQMTPSQVLQAEQLAGAFLGEAPSAARVTAQQGGRELPAPAAKPLAIASLRPADEAALVPAAQPTTRPRRADAAVTRSEMIEIQQILNSLGYHAGTSDGRVGARTRAAARLFLEDTGGSGTAGLDRKLLTRLQDVRASLPPEPAKPSSQKDLARRIQTALNALGYPTGRPDGVVGRKTLTAVRQYRSDLGYKVRDEMTRGLLRVTETRLAVRAAARSGAPPRRARASVPKRGTAKAAPVKRLAAPRDGPELVKRVQTALTGLGYAPGPADGASGTRTRDAVRRYQKRAGLEADGRITQALLARLEAGDATQAKPGPRLRFVRPSNQRELVRRAQVRLNSLGYPAGAPDGLSGQKTTAAVRAFQSRSRLPANGRLSEDVLRALEQPDAPKPAGKKRNLSGQQLVREIQSELNRLGYPAGTADGIIGRRTVDAAKAFQRDVGAPASGKLTRALLQTLRTAR